MRGKRDGWLTDIGLSVIRANPFPRQWVAMTPRYPGSLIANDPGEAIIHSSAPAHSTRMAQLA